MTDAVPARPERADLTPQPAPPADPPAATAATQPGAAPTETDPTDEAGSSEGRRRRRGSRGGRRRKRPSAPAAEGSPALDSPDRPPAPPVAEVTAASGRERGDAPAAGAAGMAGASSGVAGGGPREPVFGSSGVAGGGPGEPVSGSSGVAGGGEPVSGSSGVAGGGPGETLSPPRPKIGDTRPAPSPRPTPGRPAAPATTDGRPLPPTATNGPDDREADAAGRRRRRSGRGRGAATVAGRPGTQPAPPVATPVEAVLVDEPPDVDDDTLERRRGRERKGRPVGRYLMVVQVLPNATQIAVLEGRALIEHYVSRPADDATQIDGNVYLGRVQNVLPGMEAAFVDIGTPKNAVLYRGDVRYDTDDVDVPSDDAARPTRGRLPGPAGDARIEQLLKGGQTILCQVTKNPIGTKGARLTQEVSLPGRFVVLIPNSDTYGISKRLPDEERRRLRRILDDVRPPGHGLIVRTAAEGSTPDELRRDVERLLRQWERIDALARSARAPALLYREPSMAVRVIREEFNRDYRGVVIDDRALYEEVRDYVASITAELADRVEFAGDTGDPLPVFERYHVHEQIHKALDRKVWLPSGGSLIIDRTEALTVIDVNTGKNVGTSNLEETVFRNNLEAADEIARQLRLRDIGGIIVIDFIDMEIAANRADVIKTFRDALARDKTRTQVYDISELGLVEMTRKRISEGLVESFSQTCPTCGGRGLIFDESLLG